MSLMTFKARNANIIINFEPAFRKELVVTTNLAKMCQYEKFKANLTNIDTDISGHPMLTHVSKFGKSQLLPVYVIGDPERLQ